MKAYKGFNADMTCRPADGVVYQYAEGETYEHDGKVVACESGFHACPDPVRALDFYPPYKGAVYHEVEADDVVHDIDKIAARKIKIGARLSIVGLVKAHLDFVWRRDGIEEKVAKATEAASSGDRSTAASSGDRSTAASSGDQSTAASSGDLSTAASSGWHGRASADGPESLAVAGGYQGAAKGTAGCWLVLTERDDDGAILTVKTVKVGAKHKGRRIQPDTWYTLTDGQIVEAAS